MQSSGIWYRVALVRNDVSEETIASIIWMRRIGELGTTLEVNSNRTTVRREFFRNVGFNKTHLATHPTRRHSLLYNVNY
jgi:hypothetical protein